MRFFLVDQVTSLEEGKEIRGIKCVTLSDETVHDHFPDHPIFPGTLITEALAQLSGFLLEQTFNGKDKSKVLRAVIVKIDSMKFYETAGPGDRLELKSVIQSLQPAAARVRVEVHNDGTLLGRGALTFAMLEIESSNVTKQRKYLYNIWTREFDDRPEFH